MKKIRVLLSVLMVMALLASVAGCGRLFEGAIDRAMEEAEKAMETLETDAWGWDDTNDQKDATTAAQTTEAPRVSLDWPTDKMGGLSKPSGADVTDIFSMAGSTSVTLANFENADAEAYAAYLEGLGYEMYMESMDGTGIYFYLNTEDSNVMVSSEGDGSGSILYTAYE